MLHYIKKSVTINLFFSQKRRRTALHCIKKKSVMINLKSALDRTRPMPRGRAACAAAQGPHFFGAPEFVAAH